MIFYTPPRWKSCHGRASEVHAARQCVQPALRDVLLGPEMTAQLRPRLNAHPARGQQGSCGNNVIAVIKEHIEDLNTIETFEAQLKHMDGEMKCKYADLFPDDIPPVHHLPDTTYHRFILKNTHRIVCKREYTCPRKWQDAWRTLLEGHLAAGRMRPSNSEFSSPAFLVPKADPNAMPRWVNDYRELNENTVADKFPLPRIADILADCGRGKIWGKLDMTNAFFQTKVHPDHIKYTAVRTLFGLYEWVVMPQGCRNAPSTHQWRMVAALRPWIGKICHVYLDDIIIWSANVTEHIRNVETILQALREASLYCSLKKTSLFCTSINFLGHRISTDGIQADSSKAAKISAWPVPKMASDVRQFLGLVWYLSAFLPHLAELTSVLTPLTNKVAGGKHIVWREHHQSAFDDIKKLIASRDCLTVIDHENLGDNNIFVTTDTSDLGTGAVLSFGKDWASARPVAFESKQLSPAEKNYPTHDKEMLTIVRALHKWRNDLLGAEFEVYTGHRTLEFFNQQRDLSKKQLQWQEFLADFNFSIKYVCGEDNTVADVLSCQFSTDESIVAPVLTVSTDSELIKSIKTGYESDPWCLKLLRDGINVAGISRRGGMLYVSDRLVIPRVPSVRESLFCLAHDSLGHFGASKSYEALWDSFYWPNMRRNLEHAYIPGCTDCQRNKFTTSKPTGPLHSLPVPDGHFQDIALDFVGPLPEDDGFDYLLTITDRLGADICLIPCRKDITAE